ncbi:MAG TPA: hypothetical protein PLK31_02725, partial [Chloroflexota bacterium]|nr:hypothetical protein [Chloroflexota bacterium]
MLGVILFESLTGRKPFLADTPVKQLMAHVLEPVPNILTFNPDLPPDCDTVIQRALAKDRDARFSSAEELTEALTITLTGRFPSIVTGDSEATTGDSKAVTGDSKATTGDSKATTGDSKATTGDSEE